MSQEFEVKFLDINPQEIETKLKQIGAEKVGDYFYRRKVFDFPNWVMDKRGAWIRLRDEGDRITLTYKQRLGIKAHDGSASDEGMEEIEVVVSDFHKTEQILLQTGLVEKTYMENKIYGINELEYQRMTFTEMVKRVGE